MNNSKGEIATFLTFATLIIIGVTTLVSTVFLKNPSNKITSSSKAQFICSSTCGCDNYGNPLPCIDDTALNFSNSSTVSTKVDTNDSSDIAESLTKQLNDFSPKDTITPIQVKTDVVIPPPCYACSGDNCFATKISDCFGGCDPSAGKTGCKAGKMIDILEENPSYSDIKVKYNRRENTGTSTNPIVIPSTETQIFSTQISQVYSIPKITKEKFDDLISQIIIQNATEPYKIDETFGCNQETSGKIICEKMANFSVLSDYAIICQKGPNDNGGVSNCQPGATIVEAVNNMNSGQRQFTQTRSGSENRSSGSTRNIGSDKIQNISYKFPEKNKISIKEKDIYPIDPNALEYCLKPKTSGGECTNPHDQIIVDGWVTMSFPEGNPIIFCGSIPDAIRSQFNNSDRVCKALIQ